MLKKFLVFSFMLISISCFAQSNPGLSYGQVPTPGQWNSYFSNKLDYILPSSSGNCLTSNGSSWISVPCAGQTLPVQAITGTSHVFVTADLYSKTRRSNSGSAMTDTLLASTASGMVNGAQINIVNSDSSATDTITAGSGTTIAGNSTFIIQPGRDLSWTYDAPNTTWRAVANTGDSILFANTPPNAGQLFGGNAIPGISSAITIGSGLTLSSGTLTATGSGGTITGPVSSTNGYVPTWNGTGGTVLGAGLPVSTSGNSTIVETTSGGLLAPSILPNPTASTLGGIESIANSSHNWISYINTSGVPIQSQPSVGDISGFGAGVAAAAANAASGSGSLCLTTSCTMVTPALGTPSSGIATNLTGIAAGLTAGTANNIAGSSANAIPYQTGTGTTGFMSVVNSGVVVTSSGGVPSESTTLPSGIAATNEILTTPTVNGYIEGACTPTITAGAITITVTGVPTGCSTISTLQKLSLVANTTVTLPAPSSGVSYSLLICASGAYSPTFAIASGNLSWFGSAPTPTATNGKCDLYSFVAHGSSYLFGSALLNATGS